MKKGKEPETGRMEGEEEAVSKLLDVVGKMRTKHKLPPLSVPASGADVASDDHAMTFGIVGPDRSSSSRRDPDEGWLLVGRETAAQKLSEDNIYPIRSIYSFFVVLNSGSGTHSRPSPSGSPEDDIDDDVSASSSTSSTSITSSEDSPQQDPDAAVFATVKQHEDCAWSVLASIHVAGSEAVDSASKDSPPTSPDVVVVDDPLCIINEYIRYLRGEDATPPPGGRKRRRVHVHENIIDRRTCRIRILTADQSEAHDAATAEQSKQEFLQGQQELLQLLEQKLRKLQQTDEFSSAVNSPCPHSPPTSAPENRP